MTIKVGKDGVVDLKHFKDMVDTSIVVYYSLKVNKDKTLSLKFYNKSKKLVKPYAKA
jgi:hypothetical protein